MWLEARLKRPQPFFLQAKMSKFLCAVLVLVLAVMLVVAADDQCPDPQSIPNPAAYVQLQIQLNQISSRLDQLTKRVDQMQYTMNKVVSNKHACARATVAEGLPLTLIINKTTSFSVLVRDCGGYDLTTGGDNVTATLSCLDYPTLVSPKPLVVDNGDGSYQVSLTPECSGNNLMCVNINGKSIKDMPVTVAVIPPYTSLRLQQTITGVGHAYAIDIAENGDAYVGSWSNHNIYHINRNGKKIRSWRIPDNSPHSVLVHGGNVFVSQCNPPKLHKYTRSGDREGHAFTDACYVDLIVGPDGRLYGSDASNGRIAIFNMKDGSFFHAFSGEHVTGNPRGIGFDQDGNIHFGRYESSAVQVSTLSGMPIHSYTPPSATLSDGLFIDKAGNRLVVDRGAPSKVIITDKNNNLINKLATDQGQASQNVAIAPNGDVWVTHSNDKVLVYSV